MAIDKELLEILACPKCKGELHLTVDESELRCDAFVARNSQLKDTYGLDQNYL